MGGRYLLTDISLMVNYLQLTDNGILSSLTSSAVYSNEVVVKKLPLQSFVLRFPLLRFLRLFAAVLRPQTSG